MGKKLLTSLAGTNSVAEGQVMGAEEGKELSNSVQKRL
jgi:hypothetical protein